MQVMPISFCSPCPQTLLSLSTYFLVDIWGWLGCHGDLLAAKEFAALLFCCLYGNYPSILQLAQNLKGILAKKQFKLRSIRNGSLQLVLGL